MNRIDLDVPERREFQRLQLSTPLDGWFGDWSITLVDVSATGARFALVNEAIDEAIDETIPDGSRALLRFWWRGEEIEVTAETVHDSGLRFVDGHDVMRRLIADSVREVLLAQEANAAGNREANIVGDSTLTSASQHLGTSFVVWRLVDGTWKSRPSILPEQPQDGFTVSVAEPPDQVELLCRTYESGDAESRRLTRLLAELSVSASM